MDAVAFAAGEDADFLLLICTRKIKSGNIATGVDLSFTKFERIRTARNFFVDSFLRVEGAGLVNVCQLHGLADLDGSAVRFLLPNDHLQQGSFPCAVRTHDPDNGAGGNG